MEAWLYSGSVQVCSPQNARLRSGGWRQVDDKGQPQKVTNKNDIGINKTKTDK